MIRSVLVAIVALTFALPSYVKANPTPIAVDLLAGWEHELTGIQFPAEIADLSRSSIADIGNQKLDIFAIYRLPDGKTEATVYVFRAGLNDASIWHDRIVAIIGLGRLGQADVSNATRTLFSAPGGNGGGYRTVVPMAGKGVTASGISIFQHGDWLVAVRMSSQSLSAADLDTKLATFTSALPTSAPLKMGQPPYLIEDCPDRLPTKQAKRAKADMSSALLSGLFGQMIDSGEVEPDEAATSAAPVTYCRDSTSTNDYGVYRSGPPADGYVVAFGDAGVAAFVHRDSAAELLGKASGQYALSLVTVDRNLNFTAFRGLPTPSQVMATLRGEAPASSTGRPIGKEGDRTISINPGK